MNSWITPTLWRVFPSDPHSAATVDVLSLRQQRCYLAVWWFTPKLVEFLIVFSTVRANESNNGLFFTALNVAFAEVTRIVYLTFYLAGLRWQGT